jgi:hypothetical protein
VLGFSECGQLRFERFDFGTEDLGAVLDDLGNGGVDLVGYAGALRLEIDEGDHGASL